MRIEQILVLVFLFTTPVYSKGETNDLPDAAYGKLTNYHLFDHQISLVAVRSGQHDESGVNDYFFETKVIATAHKSTYEDKKEKLVIEEDRGVFGEIQVKALDRWKANKGDDSNVMKISGNSIRDLVAQTMSKYEVEENQVSVEVEIKMFERAKKFYFWGEDFLIGSAHYVVIPRKGTFVKKRQNQSLNIKDKKGTFVSINIEYAKPAVDLSVKKDNKK